MKTTLIITSALLFATWDSNGQSGSHKIGDLPNLYDGDHALIDRTLEIYDSFVRARVGDSLSIAEAYEQFLFSDPVWDSLASANKLREHTDEIYEHFVPDSAYVYEWTNELISDLWMNNSIRRNRFVRTEYVGPLPNTPITGDLWATWIMIPNHPFFEEFCLYLCNDNPFWALYSDGIQAAGDYTPTLHLNYIFEELDVDYILDGFAKQKAAEDANAVVEPVIGSGGLSPEQEFLYECLRPFAGKKQLRVSFDSKYERFMVALGFMGGCLDHRDFNLAKDVETSDLYKTRSQYKHRLR